MGATTVTGKGPGDSHKRIAYLSRDLSRLAVTETTTNWQDLITTPGGGGDCCVCQDWEFAYTRAVASTAPNDSAPVDTGVAFDPAYEWFFGVHLEPVGPIIPFSNPTLIGLLVTDYAPVSPIFVWSPDGNTQFSDNITTNNPLHLDACAVMPPQLLQLVYFSSQQASIFYDGSGINAPAGNFTTKFFNSSFNNVYFLILRRPL